MKQETARGDTGRRLMTALALAALCLCLLTSGLAGTAAAAEDGFTVYDGYAFFQEDGLMKYWLDLIGRDLQLHCRFLSGGADIEEVYTLGLDTAEVYGDTLVFNEIIDDWGYNVTSWFPVFSLTFRGDSVTLIVERDETTLIGGESENLLSGTYTLEALFGRGDVIRDVAEEYWDYLAYHDCSYYLDNGHLKYWIEFGEWFELHCMFQSGSPDYYEAIYYLYPDFDASDAGRLVIGGVEDDWGYDVTGNFRRLEFLFSPDGSVLMEVERDESTLAGGSSDNVLTGEYVLTPPPAAASVVQERLGGTVPAVSGGYTPEELCVLAQQYYERETGYYPPVAEYEDNGDGTITIHLYENVDPGDGMAHTATAAWYTVDAWGVGTDIVMGGDIYLIP